MGLNSAVVPRDERLETIGGGEREQEWERLYKPTPREVVGGTGGTGLMLVALGVLDDGAILLSALGGLLPSLCATPLEVLRRAALSAQRV